MTQESFLKNVFLRKERYMSKVTPTSITKVVFAGKNKCIFSLSVNMHMYT